MRTIFEDIGLADASVDEGTSFLEAAEHLVKTTSPMIAVLDADRRVTGLFGSEEALRGVLPRYLAELHHTAFAKDDDAVFARRAEAVRGEPVEKHAVKPVTVELDSSALHCGELFLHCRLPAIAVVEQGRFVGMLDRAEFARAMVRRTGGEGS
jgi:CBS-domain-containing membrane protein